MNMVSSRRRLAHALAAGSLPLSTMTACVAAEDPVRIPAPVKDPAPVNAGPQKAVFAGGCFWGVQGVFQHVKGVQRAVSGYAGGALQNPTYENHRGHLEAVKVTYDPARISYAQLVDGFFHHIDPTDAGGQICDRGPSYTTAVFVADGAETATAQAVKAQVAKTLGKPVASPDQDGDGRYAELETAEDEPIILLQKVGHDARVHLDIETDDVEAEAERLVALGAKKIAFIKRWWVMEAPSGHRFCVVRQQRKPFGPHANRWE